jgi:hypothetical protein
LVAAEAAADNANTRMVWQTILNVIPINVNHIIPRKQAQDYFGVLENQSELIVDRKCQTSCANLHQPSPRGKKTDRGIPSNKQICCPKRSTARFAKRDRLHQD